MASYIDLNNLGSFTNIEALWAAYPEGGQEGDYCTIASVRYRWDKYDRMWVADPNFGPTPARSVTTFDGDVNMQNNLTVAGYIRAKGIKQPCLGLFASTDALTAKWPNPEVGMWALVGNSMSSTSPAAVYRCDTEGTWAATGGTAYIDGLEINVANGITGWVPISATSQLPTEPTPDQQGKGYLLGTMLYVYVGTGGDTLSGKYQSAELKGADGQDGAQGPKGDPGGQLQGYVTVVNDLVTGGEEDVLSAEQGKKLGQAMSLVVDILKSSVYTADKSTEIEELEDMFDNYVDVTKSLTNVSVSPDVSTVAKGTSLTLTFTPSSSHVIDAVTVAMGGVSQTVTIAQDQKSATCTIASVSGSIEITATAVYQETDLVDGVTPTSGYGILAQGNYGSNSNFSSILIPIQFGKRYKVTDYDWTGGTQTGYNVGLVKSDGNGGYTSLTSADLVSGSVFAKNNNLLTVASTYVSKIWQTPVVPDFTFVTPKQTDLNGIDAIYLVINTRYSTLDITGTFHVYEWKDSDETFTAADEVKSLGLIWSTYNLGGNPSSNAFYNVAFVKAIKGATINYSGYNWSSLGATGDGYAIGLLKGDGQMFENLTANDLSGSAWLSNDTFFLHSDNLYKKRCDASGSFTIPSNTDYAGDIYIAINTAFGTSSSYENKDVKNTFTLTQE